MVLGMGREGYIMPPLLRAALTNGHARDQWAGFTAATALARSGFPVLPCQPGGKAPLVLGPFQHGARSATTDVEAVRDVWMEEPAANVAFAPWAEVIVLDIDPRSGGSLEAAEGLGLPVDGYRERSGGGGWHLPLLAPVGHPAIRSARVGPGLELKGPGSYVVSPASRLTGGGAYLPEPERDIWTWPRIPASCALLDRLTRRSTPAAYAIGTISAAHRVEAAKVLHQLQRDRFGAQVRAILAGKWAWRYPSASERDSGLLLMATWFTRDPQVLAAILHVAGLLPLGRKPDPGYYAGRTVAAVLAERERRENAAASTPSSKSPVLAPAFLADFDLPAVTFEGARILPTVIYGTLHNERIDWNSRAFRILLMVVEERGIDDHGFCRLNVQVAADLLRVNRRSILRDIDRLEFLGQIETDIRQQSVYRRERWIRLTEAGWQLIVQRQPGSPDERRLAA